MRPERCEQEGRVDVAFTPRPPQWSSTLLHPRSVPCRAAVPRDATRQHMCLHGGLAAGLLCWFLLDASLLNLLWFADSKWCLLCCGFQEKFSKQQSEMFSHIYQMRLGQQKHEYSVTFVNDVFMKLGSLLYVTCHHRSSVQLCNSTVNRYRCIPRAGSLKLC